MQQRYFPRMGAVARNARQAFPRASEANNRRETVITFRSSQTYLVQNGVALLSSVVGIGASGKPASGSHDYRSGYDTIEESWISSNGAPYVKQAEENVGWTESSSTPSYYCDPPTALSPEVNYYKCYRFQSRTVDFGDYVGPTTGSNASAFGRTFPGGVGGPASEVKFNNVPVVGGTTYSIIIPVGCYIRITYG